MMYLDKKKIVDSLSKEDVIEVLSTLGSDHVETKKGELMFRTVCHHENATDGKHHLYYYEKNKSGQASKKFYCISDCQGEKGFDIFTLVQKSFSQRGEKISFYNSMRYVLSALGRQENDCYVNRSEAAKLQEKQKTKEEPKVSHIYFENEEEKEIELKIIEPNKLDMFPKLHYQGWLMENIKHKTMDKYEIRFDVYSNKIIIPHFNIKGDIVGVKGRSLNKEDELNNKYVFIKIEGREYGYKQGDNLYGLNFNKDNIAAKREVILFESEKSVLQMDGYFNESIAVSVSGCKIGHEQLRMLYKLGVEDITIAFDKEYTNEQELEKYIALYRNAVEPYGNMFRFNIIIDRNNLLGHKDSPSDKGRNAFCELYFSKIKL